MKRDHADRQPAAALSLDTIGKWLVITHAAVFPMTLWSGTIGALLAAEVARTRGVIAHAANNLINDYFDMTPTAVTE
jgi:1,4-dihydroxy-2-naphthoate octaprenyltransferase